MSTSFYRLLTFPGRLSSNHLSSMTQQSTRRLMLWQYMLCPWSCSGSIIIKASGSDKLFEKLLFNSPLVISLNLQKRCQRKEVTLSKKRKNYNRYFLSTVSLFLLAWPHYSLSFSVFSIRNWRSLARLRCACNCLVAQWLLISPPKSYHPLCLNMRWCDFRISTGSFALVVLILLLQLSL